jgi:stringent starvation protein B
LALLEQASMYIHLDPRADSVQVPAWFKKQPQLVLQVGLNMAVPIPDLHVDEQGLSCTLSFNRAPFFCMIPWRAVFALVGEKGQAMVWAEDVPAEVAAQAQAQKQPERPRGHLRSVAEGEGAPPAAATPETASEPRALSKKAAKKAPRPNAKEAKAPPPKRAAASKPAAMARPAAKKADSPKPNAAKKPTAKVAPQKPEAQPQPAPKPAARPKAALAAKQAEKPSAPRGTTEASKPKRELPPYLRVVK